MTRSRTSSTGCIFALTAVLVFGLMPRAEAGPISVADRWAAERYVSLDNRELRLVFSQDDTSVRVYDLSGTDKTPVATLTPLDPDGRPATGTSACTVLSQSGNEARCELTFASGTGPIASVFALKSNGAIQVRSGENLEAISISAPFAYGVLPSRHLDDTIYAPADYPDSARLQIPSENLFVGLLEGNDRMLACAWPSGGQSVRLALAGDPKKRRIEAIEIDPADRELSIGLLSAPGIWHEVELGPSYEEQDVTLDWKPPFAARWKTQLSELGTPTTFTCHTGERRQWRPTIGFYTYPFFSQGSTYILHLHKRLDSEGKALIYALEGHRETPFSFLTANLPIDEQRNIEELKAVVHYYVLDPSPTPGGAIMAAHCSGRDQLKYTTLAVGAQAREVPFLDTHISDRVHECRVILKYSIRRALDRMTELDEYLAGRLETQADSPQVSTFLGALRGTLNDMQRDYTARLGGDTPEEKVEHVERTAVKYRAVIREGAGLEQCSEILYYINELNAIISLDEDEGRRFGTWARGLFQQAAYACTEDPIAAQYAVEIRAALREHMKYRQYESPRLSGYASALVSGG